MDIGGSYCHDSLNTNRHAAVSLDTDDDSFHTFEDTTGDTNTVAFLQGGGDGVEVDNLLFVIARNGNEATHLGIRDGDRTAKLLIEDVTDSQRKGDGLTDTFDAFQRGTDEDKVMHHGDQFTYFTLPFLDALVVHRNEVLNLFGIQNLFQEKLAAVSDAKRIPVYVGGFVHNWIFFRDTGVVKTPSGQACIKEIINELYTCPQ